MKPWKRCHKIEIKQPVIWLLFLSIPFLWKCSPDQRNVKPWRIDSLGDNSWYPIFYGNEEIVLTSRCGTKDCLKAVKKNNGKIVWEWPDPDSIRDYAEKMFKFTHTHA